MKIDTFRDPNEEITFLPLGKRHSCDWIKEDIKNNIATVCTNQAQYKIKTAFGTSYACEKHKNEVGILAIVST